VWSYTLTPPVRLHGVVLGYKKHRDNLLVCSSQGWMGGWMDGWMDGCMHGRDM